MDIATAVVRRCKTKERRAFDELFRRYEQPLYRICRGYSRNADEAMDIMQEVYIKIFRHIQSFDESRPLLPWLKQLTVNTCLNYRRDNKEPSLLSLDWPKRPENDDAGNGGSWDIPSAENVEAAVIDQSMAERLDRLLAQLPDHYRMVLTLRYTEDLSYEQIAQRMELPLNTVKSHIHRGRQHIRRQLAEQGWMEV